MNMLKFINIKKLKIYVLIFISILSLVSCNNKKQNIERKTYYMFDTPDYFDYNEENNVLYLKSHKQLKEVYLAENTNDILRDDINIKNALGHDIIFCPDTVSEITIDTTDTSYDIALHLHPGDSNIVVTSSIDLHEFAMCRYYMMEKFTLYDKSVFEFVDCLCIDSEIISSTEYMYSFNIKNIKDIDFDNGERLVLEYSDENNQQYYIPIPYQLLIGI